MPSKTIYDAIREAGQLGDTQIPLIETALLLGALDMPEADLDAYRSHIEDLTRDVAEAGRSAQDEPERALVLSRVLAETYGYDGDQLTFDRPDNANLVSVIDRRRGLPVTLGLLYLHAGRAAGWTVDGMNFPGHFLVCVGEGDEIVVIDPFHSGRILTEHELNGYLQRVRGANAKIGPADLGVMSNRAILIRLVSNIKQRAIKAEDTARALEVAERLVLLAPNKPAVLYDFAMLNAQTGHLALALDTLHNAAQHSSDEGFRKKVLTSLDAVKRRLN